MDPSEHGDALGGATVEVVVVGDGGDPEAGVVLRRGVGAITVSRVVRDAGFPVVSEFGCFLILALDTAHPLLSNGNKEGTNRISRYVKTITQHLQWKKKGNSILYYVEASSAQRKNPSSAEYRPRTQHLKHSTGESVQFGGLNKRTHLRVSLLVESRAAVA